MKTILSPVRLGQPRRRGTDGLLQGLELTLQVIRPPPLLFGVPLDSLSLLLGSLEGSTQVFVLLAESSNLPREDLKVYLRLALVSG